MLNLDFPNGHTVGLFPNLKNSTVKNLIVEGYVRGLAIVGGIAGRISETTISNCINLAYIENTVAPTFEGIDALGGIVGRAENSSVINNCLNLGDVTGVTAGGIVGILDKSVVSDCMNTGYVKGLGKYNGGIVGISYNMPWDYEISNCLNLGTVEGEINTTGPICGFCQ